MPVTRPFRRTCRPFFDGRYFDARYVVHPKFAQSPEHYVRAFQLLQKDLLELFDYVEPADRNLNCYSYRIHSLLLRACVEVEANCKAILKENGYSRPGDWNARDYRKVDATHRLSSFTVKVPNWHGSSSLRAPFTAWSGTAGLPWYTAYNATKHDRHTEFEQATFEHLIDAACGVLVLLSAQFGREDFSPGGSPLFAMVEPDDGMHGGIGDYFRVRFPQDWPEDDKYNFEWDHFRNEQDPFASIDYSAV